MKPNEQAKRAGEPLLELAAMLRLFLIRHENVGENEVRFIARRIFRCLFFREQVKPNGFAFCHVA